MSLARLLQLASPTLPVGAYSYSQGLEAAIEGGLVSDEKSAAQWIGDVLRFSVATMDAPILQRMLTEPARIAELNELYLATRESAELRAETVQMGQSLRVLLTDLGVSLPELVETAFPTAFALAAAHGRIDPDDALVAYLWAWLEGQVMAAVKAVPLGQTAGQRMLMNLGNELGKIAQRAAALPEAQWSNLAPNLALLSSRHETQYSRLFRS